MTRTGNRKALVATIAHPHVLLGVGVLALAAFAVFGMPRFFGVTYDTTSATTTEPVTRSVVAPPAVVHITTPHPVKAVYMSQCVAGTRSFRDQIVKLIDETELNSVVIDIKDYSGRISFPTTNSVLKDAVSTQCLANDMRDFVKTLHEKNIYVIGRVTVFQDPYYTKMHPELAVKKASDGTVWKDHKGLAFIDVGAEPFWKYIAEIATESYAIGFDEINFDYVRYPSDGDMQNIAYTWSGKRAKADVLKDFFAYLHDTLHSKNIPISVDFFGMTTTNSDDLNIGQVLENGLLYFDYVMPMVYPSHYPPHFNGWLKPATMPYEVVQFSMAAAVRRADALHESASTTPTSLAGQVTKDKLRPWLQDFDLGAKYTPDMVKAQMKATYDVGLTSWALWDAGNTYTRSALLPQ